MQLSLLLDIAINLYFAMVARSYWFHLHDDKMIMVRSLYVCMYVCMFAQLIMRICVCICEECMHVCMYVCMFAQLIMRICVCICEECMHVCMYVCMYVCPADHEDMRVHM